MSDIVERLRQWSDCYGVQASAEMKEAATKIERLRAALRPFADESLWCGPQHEFVTVKRSDCDKARAALEDRT